MSVQIRPGGPKVHINIQGFGNVQGKALQNEIFGKLQAMTGIGALKLTSDIYITLDGKKLKIGEKSVEGEFAKAGEVAGAIFNYLREQSTGKVAAAPPKSYPGKPPSTKPTSVTKTETEGKVQAPRKPALKTKEACIKKLKENRGQPFAVYKKDDGSIGIVERDGSEHVVTPEYGESAIRFRQKIESKGGTLLPELDEIKDLSDAEAYMPPGSFAYMYTQIPGLYYLVIKDRQGDFFRYQMSYDNEKQVFFYQDPDKKNKLKEQNRQLEGTFPLKIEEFYANKEKLKTEYDEIFTFWNSRDVKDKDGTFGKMRKAILDEARRDIEWDCGTIYRNKVIFHQIAKIIYEGHVSLFGPLFQLEKKNEQLGQAMRRKMQELLNVQKNPLLDDMKRIQQAIQDLKVEVKGHLATKS